MTCFHFHARPGFLISGADRLGGRRRKLPRSREWGLPRPLGGCIGGCWPPLPGRAVGACGEAVVGCGFCAGWLEIRSEKEAATARQGWGRMGGPGAAPPRDHCHLRGAPSLPPSLLLQMPMGPLWGLHGPQDSSIPVRRHREGRHSVNVARGALRGGDLRAVSEGSTWSCP